jgi:hypothetical protein
LGVKFLKNSLLFPCFQQVLAETSSSETASTTIPFSDNVKIALFRGTARIFGGVCAFVLANVVLLMMADFADVDSIGQEMGQSACTENLSADLFVVSKGPRA